MDELDEDFEKFITTIENFKNDFSEDEQNIINAWINKLQADEYTDKNERLMRNEYAYFLQKMLQEPETGLDFPFNEMPPESQIKRLSDFKMKKRSLSWDDENKSRSLSRDDGSGGRRTSSISRDDGSGGRRTSSISRDTGTGSRISDRSPERKPCCTFESRRLSSPERPKPQQNIQNLVINEFENQEEMAKIIARSKGQSIFEFIAALSPHTSDRGVKLRNALKVESNAYKEYVNRIVSQRFQDLTDILAKEQKAEMERITSKSDEWQLEIVHIRNRIQEIVPDFDFDLFDHDKDYLRKFFMLELQNLQQRKLPDTTEDDELTEWKEEACHRLRWFHEEIHNLESESKEIKQAIEETRSKMLILESKAALKEQNYIECLEKINTEIENLKQEKSQIEAEIEKRCRSLKEPSRSPTREPSRLPTREPSRSPTRRPSKNY